MALPVAKLGTLALRTLSKPIASRLKSQAAVHPKFRNFIIAIAQVIALSSSSFFDCLVLILSGFNSIILDMYIKSYMIRCPSLLSVGFCEI
jgi:hypothetical protein